MALNLGSQALQIPVAPIFSSEEVRKKHFLAFRARKEIKDKALQELLKLRNSNGGRAKYGDIPSILKMYHNKLGYEYITWGVLCYMLSERDSAPVESIEIQTEHSGSDRSNVSSIFGTQTSNTDSNQIWACNGVVLGGKQRVQQKNTNQMS
jgi:hypothetical protein